MKTNRLFACLAMALIAAPAHPQDAESVDEILKKMAETMAGVESWTADIEMDMNMMGMQMSVTGKMTQAGTRSAMEMTMEMEMPGLEGLVADAEESQRLNESMGGIKMKIVLGEDGIQWTETNMMGQLQVMKMDMSKMMEMGREMLGLGGLMGGGNPMEMMGDPAKMLEMYNEFMDFELVGKDTVGGVEVYVLKGSMKTGAPGTEDLAEGLEALGALGLGMDSLMDGITMKVGVEDGFVRETVMGEMDGKPMMVMRMNNVKLNVEFDDSIFVYTPPPGVTVMDMTEMMSGNLDGLLDSAGENVQPEYNTKFSVGDTAPDFSGNNLEGETVALASYKGKVVLLDFWATWCGPCIAELPNVLETYAKYHDQGLQIIGISLDDDRDAMVQFLAEHETMTWAQIFDGKGWGSEVGALYGVEAIPFTLLLGKDGVIVHRDLRGDGLPKAVEALLAGSD